MPLPWCRVAIGAPSAGNSNDPALTGGGSIGYNQMLLQY